MLSKNELLQVLKEFRQEIREEIVSEGSITRNEIKSLAKEVDSRFTSVESHITSIETRIQTVEIKTNSINYGLETLDLKIENYNIQLNSKLDTLREDVLDGFLRVLDTVDQLNTKLVKRVDQIEKHLSLHAI